MQRFLNVNTIVDMREMSVILMKSWSMESAVLRIVSCLDIGTTQLSSRLMELCK